MRLQERDQGLNDPAVPAPARRKRARGDEDDPGERLPGDLSFLGKTREVGGVIGDDGAAFHKRVVEQRWIAQAVERWIFGDRERVVTTSAELFREPRIEVFIEEQAHAAASAPASSAPVRAAAPRARTPRR